MPLKVTPYMRKKLVRAVAVYGYDEYRVGSVTTRPDLPMWHHLPLDDRRRHEARAALMLDVYGVLSPAKPKSKAKRTAR